MTNTHNPDANITMKHGTDAVYDADLWNAGKVYTEAYMKQAIAEATTAERERCIKIASYFEGSLWSLDDNRIARYIINEIQEGK